MMCGLSFPASHTTNEMRKKSRIFSLDACIFSKIRIQLTW